MKPIFEYNDTLNNPYEAFLFNSQSNPFSITPYWNYFIEIIAHSYYCLIISELLKI